MILLLNMQENKKKEEYDKLMSYSYFLTDYKIASVETFALASLILPVATS